jgi:carboxyl-terminal processing protease
MKKILYLIILIGFLFTAHGFGQETEAMEDTGEADQEAVEFTPRIPEISRDVVLQDLDMVWNVVAEAYVDPEFNGADWEALKEEYAQTVKAAEDTPAAYRAVNELLGVLHGDNNFVVPPWLVPSEEDVESQDSGIELEYGGVGILLQELESGDVMVLNVFRATPAEESGVLIGDIIVGVNDWRVEGENPVQAIADRVRGPVGTTVDLVLKDPDGEERRLTVARAHIDLRPSVEDRFVSGSVGYIRIPVLSTELVTQASRALPRLLSSTGLILDLRSVSSGSLEATLQVAQWFLGAAHLGGFVSREGASPLPYRSDAIAAYQRPVVVLTNWYTYGVAEILTFMLREYKRAQIVGNETQGGFELTQFLDLPSGGLVQITVARYASPKGNLLPIEGLEPDVVVEPPDLNTIRSGSEVYIERAVEVLRTSSRVL